MRNKLIATVAGITFGLAAVLTTGGTAAASQSPASATGPDNGTAETTGACINCW